VKLKDAIDQIKLLDDDKVIFARKPWELESDTCVDLLDAGQRVPAAISTQGFDYFLEVSVAQEVLEVFAERKPTKDEQRALLMFYAENDAYPQWVYER
jgi:hypothetical protein